MVGTDSFEKILMLGKIEDRRRWGRQDEMVGWQHQLNGHEFALALGVGDRQRSLVCCSPWGHKESDMTEQLNSKRMHQKTQCTHLFLFQDFSLLLRQAVQSLRDHSAMPLKSPVFSFSLQLLTVYLLSLGPQGCCLGSRYSSGLGERRGKGKLKGGVTSCTGPYFQSRRRARSPRSSRAIPPPP